jgi:cytochrome c553
MQYRKTAFSLLIVGMAIVIATGLWLASAPPASAQCGSQASSCKNCHEVQGQKPVNNDGTGWHQSHAFGDFCYLCHAGNQQATAKDAAHAGMVPPLQDIKTSCSSCHVKDTTERAKIYADKLGISLGAGAAPAGKTPVASPTQTASAAGGSGGAPVLPVAGNAVVVENQPVIDYVEQYNESVLGQTTVNWGNVIVAIMIVVIVIIGGAFVYLNERKLRGAHASQPQKAGEQPDPIRLEDYPAEIVALLPRLKALNPVGRKSLGKLLANPEAASDLLYTLSRLDPDLIKRIKGLDREAQALLIALAGD